MPGFGDFLSGLLSPIRKGLDDVAYQAMGGPLLGQQFQTPQPVVTPQGLMAAANQTTPQQTPAAGAPQAASPTPVATGGGPFQTPDSAGAPSPPASPTADDYYYGGADPTAALPGGQVTIPGAAATTAQPTSGNRIQQALLAGAQALQQKPSSAPWTPTPTQQRSMTSSLLGNIGAAMQMGVPIQYGIDQYRKATLDMMTTQQKARDAASHQQVLQAFTAAMGAAGDDPRAQQAVIMQFAAALPKDELVGMADVQKAFRPPINKPVGKPYAIVGPDGKPVLMQAFEQGAAQPVGTPTGDQKDRYSYTPDGNVLDKSSGVVVPGPVLKALVDKNGGDIDAAFKEYKGANRQASLGELTDADIQAAWAKDHNTTVDQMDASDRTAARAWAEDQKNQVKLDLYRKEHPPADIGTVGSGGLLDAGLKTTSGGKQYLDLTDFEKKDLGALMVAARKQGIPYVDKDGAQSLRDIDTTRLNMTQLWNTLNKYLASSAAGRPEQALKNKFGEIMQTNPELAAMGQFRDTAVQAMRAVAGSKGIRMNRDMIKLAQDNLPQDTDTLDVARTKLRTLAGLLNNIENANLVVDRSTLLPGAAPAQAPAPAAPTTALPQAGGMFNGERVKSIKKIQ